MCLVWTSRHSGEGTDKVIHRKAFILMEMNICRRKYMEEKDG